MLVNQMQHFNHHLEPKITMKQRAEVETYFVNFTLLKATFASSFDVTLNENCHIKEVQVHQNIQIILFYTFYTFSVSNSSSTDSSSTFGLFTIDIPQIINIFNIHN